MYEATAVVARGYKKCCLAVTVQLRLAFWRHFEHWLTPVILPSTWASCSGLSGCLPMFFSCLLERTAPWHNSQHVQSVTSLCPGFENDAAATAVLSICTAFMICLQQNSVQTVFFPQTILWEKSAFANTQKYIYFQKHYCHNYSPILPCTNHLKFSKGTFCAKNVCFPLPAKTCLGLVQSGVRTCTGMLELKSWSL